ncbi:MAG: glycosyltransferase family 2 protein [Nitrospinota bacterium]
MFGPGNGKNGGRTRTTLNSGAGRSKAPPASVIIPTYNRRTSLAQCLQAFANQSASFDTFEVIVVDDGSVDGTAEWLEAQAFPFELRLLRQANRGPAAARNAGIAVARGDILIFFDDDEVPCTEFVREHLRSHDAEKDIAVIGSWLTVPRHRQPWVAWHQAVENRLQQRMVNGEVEPTFRQYFVGNSSIARDHAVAVGGFDPSFFRNEDIEFGYRLMTRGLHFRFNPAARAVHDVSQSFAAWFSVQSAYGPLDVQVLRRSGEMAMYGLLAEEWRNRHTLTRWLVRRSAGRRFRTAVAILILRGCVQLGRISPKTRFSRAACGALANLLYWSGVAEALEKHSSLFALLEEVGGES